jgi:hypothetical protein
MSEDTKHLVSEINAALRSDKWLVHKMPDSANDHRVYIATAFRHLEQLLRELDGADAARLEFASRLVARSLFETSILTLYMHFRGAEAYEEIRSDYALRVTTVRNALLNANGRLASDPDVGSGHQVRTVGTLNQILKEMKSSPKELKVSDMVEYCIKSGRSQKLFATEFVQIYNFYRVLSMLAPHTNVRILDEYLPNPGTALPASTLTKPNDSSPVQMARAFALHLTSFLAVVVLEDEPGRMVIANKLNKFYGSFAIDNGS